jgi:hypothetical protein
MLVDNCSFLAIYAKEFAVFSGPGGIRTRDLFSAIEARSQLRHRPFPGELGL